MFSAIRATVIGIFALFGVAIGAHTLTYTAQPSTPATTTPTSTPVETVTYNVPIIEIEEAPVPPEPIEEPLVEAAPVVTQHTPPTPPVAESTPTPPPLYTTPPLPFDTINTETLPAIVNIFCASSPRSRISGATGSGIIIDAGGVILTNAHVAQYLLLRDHPEVEVSCTIRTGAPAQSAYTAEVLAFPKAWARAHGSDIVAEMPTGTGEHDWALLYITGTTTNTPRPGVFPAVALDTREKVTTQEDAVLIAGYPAGFLSGQTLQKNLWPSSSVINIQKVFTFKSTLLDVLSLGGSVVAQGGASGGAVVNGWNKLVGLIVTSSLADTTAERDLRAITLSHIDRSVTQETGMSLRSFLDLGDFENRTRAFKETLPTLYEHFPLTPLQ